MCTLLYFCHPSVRLEDTVPTPEAKHLAQGLAYSKHATKVVIFYYYYVSYFTESF